MRESPNLIFFPKPRLHHSETTTEGERETSEMQAQAEEVEPTLLRGHLGDVGRVSL